MQSENAQKQPVVTHTDPLDNLILTSGAEQYIISTHSVDLWEWR